MSNRPAKTEPELLTASEASALLSIKRATLYSYASRGWVRSVPSPGGGGHLYARDDLARLKQRREARAGHGPVAAAALSFGEPVLQTALCRVTPRGPLYRGKEAVTLARESTFEAVCEWLWWGTPAPKTHWPAVGAPAIRTQLSAQATPLGTLLLVSANEATRRIAATPPSPDDPRRAIRLLAAAPFAAGRETALTGSVAATFAAALGRPGPKIASALEMALVLCAEHELTASTFAARIAASAGAELWACLVSGLATLTGTRHGAACDDVAAYVSALGSPARARATVSETLRRREAIPGFGHPLYPEGDPRGKELFEVARGANRAATRTFRALATSVLAATGEHPTLDFGLAALAAALELPPRSGSAIFALGRAAGLIAHVLEQRSDGRLIRPRARYVGE